MPLHIGQLDSELTLLPDDAPGADPGDAGHRQLDEESFERLCERVWERVEQRLAAERRGAGRRSGRLREESLGLRTSAVAEETLGRGPIGRGPWPQS